MTDSHVFFTAKDATLFGDGTATNTAFTDLDTTKTDLFAFNISTGQPSCSHTRRQTLRKVVATMPYLSAPTTPTLTTASRRLPDTELAGPTPPGSTSSASYWGKLSGANAAMVPDI